MSSEDEMGRLLERLHPLDGPEHRLIELLRKTPASVIPDAISAVYEEYEIRRIIADLQEVCDYLATASPLPVVYLGGRR